MLICHVKGCLKGWLVYVNMSHVKGCSEMTRA